MVRCQTHINLEPEVYKYVRTNLKNNFSKLINDIVRGMMLSEEKGQDLELLKKEHELQLKDFLEAQGKLQQTQNQITALEKFQKESELKRLRADKEAQHKAGRCPNCGLLFDDGAHKRMKIGGAVICNACFLNDSCGDLIPLFNEGLSFEEAKNKLMGVSE